MTTMARPALSQTKVPMIYGDAGSWTLLREEDGEHWRAVFKQVVNHIHSSITLSESILGVSVIEIVLVNELEEEYKSQNERLFDIRDKKNVESYLKENPSLVGTLLEVKEKIKKYFPEEALALDVTVDPHGHSETKQLIVYVVTDRSAIDAHNRLEEFDNNWWLQQLTEIGPLCSVEIEFQCLSSIGENT